MNILEKLVLQDVLLFKGFANFLLPQGHNLVKRVDVARWPDVEDLVQRSRVVNRPNCVSCNVFFLVENCYMKTKKKMKPVKVCFERYMIDIYVCRMFLSYSDN